MSDSRPYSGPGPIVPGRPLDGVQSGASAQIPSVTPYQFSSDEIRVLRECNTESFFQRSLPFGTAFGLAAYFGVKSGQLSPNPKYGAVPKVVVGVIIGYVLGKASYQKKCAEKMMRLPNSRLGEIFRQKSRGTSFAPDAAFSSATLGLPFIPPVGKVDEVYDDYHMREKSNSLDLDTDRPTSYDIDDSRRPNVDLSSENDLPLEPPKNKVSYEELRKANREQYLRTTSDIGSAIKSKPSEVPAVVRPNVQNEEQEIEQKPQRKNQYGDIWTS